jgi:hypothetical protein
MWGAGVGRGLLGLGGVGGEGVRGGRGGGGRDGWMVGVGDNGGGAGGGAVMILETSKFANHLANHLQPLHVCRG